MATQVFGRLFSKTLTLTASIYSRSLSTTSSPISFLRRLRPLSAAVITSRPVLLPPSFRSLSTCATIPSFMEQPSPSPNATALKLRNGCDYYSSVVFMQSPFEYDLIGCELTWDERELPPGAFDEIFEAFIARGPPEPTSGEREPTIDEIIDSYVKTLAELVGSEDEARMMVYSGTILTKELYAFGTLVSKELYDRVEELPGVAMILNDPTVREVG